MLCLPGGRPPVPPDGVPGEQTTMPGTLEERRHESGDHPADGAPDQAAPALLLPERTLLPEHTALAERAARPDGAPSVWRDPGTWVIATLVLGAYLVISLYKFFQLQPSSWDLGIFTEYVKQYANLHSPIVDVRGPGFNLLGDHFQVIVALIAPFFKVFPSPATLLVVQALLTAVSVFPVVAAAGALLGGREVRGVAPLGGAEKGAVVPG